jgi:hypothetical protein
MFLPWPGQILMNICNLDLKISKLPESTRSKQAILIRAHCSIITVPAMFVSINIDAKLGPV